MKISRTRTKTTADKRCPQIYEHGKLTEAISNLARLDEAAT